MKAQLEPVVLTNSVISILLFSMLTLGMSTKFSDINILQTWADASSFANSVSSRAYTSSDCFAYETGMVTEYNGKIINERKVYPGVIDVRKFTEDDYFSCIENYYAVSGSEIDYMTKNVPAYSTFLINFKLYDMEDPSRIRQLGDTMTNEKQLDWSISQTWIEEQRKYLSDMQLWADVLSLGLSIALSFVKVSISPAVKIGNLNQASDIDNNVVEFLKQSYSSYTSRVPVILRYVDDDGNIEEDHQGILETTIMYSAGAGG
jgi:hypothetical protein